MFIKFPLIHSLPHIFLTINSFLQVCLLGETNIEGKVHYEVIARQVCKDVGFDDEAKGLDYKAMSVLVNIEQQDENIANAVFKSKAEEDLGAGD